MEYITICLVALLISGLTLFSGFGLGTLLMPAFALFVPVPVAIAATAVVHLANNLFKVALVGRHADWHIGNNDLWIGYSHGLLRADYGEKYGTEGDHQLWSGISANEPDYSRRVKGVGYRMGLDGLPPTKVMQLENEIGQVTKQR